MTTATAWPKPIAIAKRTVGSTLCTLRKTCSGPSSASRKKPDSGLPSQPPWAMVSAASPTTAPVTIGARIVLGKCRRPRRPMPVTTAATSTRSGSNISACAAGHQPCPPVEM